MAFKFEAGRVSGHALSNFGPADAAIPQAEIFNGAKLGDEMNGEDQIQKFRVLKNGTTAAVAWDLQEGHTTYIQRAGGTGSGQADCTPAAIGGTRLSFQAGTSVAENLLAGGWVTVLDTIGSVLTPEMYPIWSNSASDSTDNHRVELTLGQPLRRVIATSTIVQVISSQYANCRRGTESSADAVGVPIVTIPPNFYYLGAIKAKLPLRVNADLTAAVNNKRVSKSGTGRVELADNVGRDAVGRIIGNVATANTTYNRWAMVDLDLT